MYDGKLTFDTSIDGEGFEQDTDKLAKSSKLAFAAIAAAAAAALGVLAKIGVSYNAQMEEYTTNFTTLLGSQEAAIKRVEELRVMAAKTPFGMEDLAKAEQTLLSFGIASDKTATILQQLGDISMGNKERFQALSLAFSQMSSAGRLMGQDLLQMINAGFNPLQELSVMTGKSMAELKAEMEKGAISADMVAEAFAHATAEGGKFFNGMENASKTLSGQWATLKDDTRAVIGDMFKPFTDILSSQTLPQLILLVKQFSDTIASPAIQAALTNLATGLGNFAVFGLKLASAVLPPLVSILGVVVNNLDLLAVAAGMVLAAMAAHKVMDLWSKASTSVAAATKLATNTNQELIVSLGKGTLGKLGLVKTTEQLAAAEAKETAVTARLHAEKMKSVAASARAAANKLTEEAATKKAAAAKALEEVANKRGTKQIHAMTAATQLSAAAELAELQATEASTAADLAEAAANKASTAAVGARTLATQAHTAAQNKDNVSISIGQNLVRLLTGQIGLNIFITQAWTAAQTAFNAAFAANPIGMFLLVVAALAVAIFGLVKLIGDSTSEYAKEKEKIDAATEASREHAEAIAESAAAYEDQIDSIEASTISSMELADAIEVLSQKENKSAADKKMLANYVSLLNQKQKGLNLSYDEESDLLSQNTAATKEYIAARKKIDEANALLERQIELQQEEMALMEEREKYLIQLEEIRQMYEDGTITLQQRRNMEGELNQAIDNTTKALEKNAVAQQEVNEQLSDEAIAAAQEAVAAEEAKQEAYDRTEKILKSYVDAATDMFNRLSEESKYSVQEMTDNLVHNQEVLERMGDNLASLAGRIDDEFLQMLIDMGPEAAGIIEELANATDEELAALSEAYANGGAAARDALLASMGLGSGDNTGSDVVDEIADGINSNPAMSEATKNMVDEAYAAMETALAEKDFGVVGQQIADEIIAGLDAADMSGIAEPFLEAAAEAEDATKELTDGVKSVLSKEQGSIVKTTKSITDQILSTLEQLIAKSKTVITNMMSGMLAAMKANEKKLYDKADEIANKIIEKLEKAFDIRSPSHVMFDMFTLVLKGAINGLDKAKSALYKKVDEIANGVLGGFAIEPDLLPGLNGQLMAAVAAGPVNPNSYAPAANSPGGGGGVTYVTNLIQNITSPKPLSPSEMTREGEDFLARSKWDLP